MEKKARKCRACGRWLKECNQTPCEEKRLHKLEKTSPQRSATAPIELQNQFAALSLENNGSNQAECEPPPQVRTVFGQEKELQGVVAPYLLNGKVYWAQVTGYGT